MSEDLELDQKGYEVSFLVLEEGGAAEVEKLLAANNAEITLKGPCALTKLAYKMKKHESVYFGFFHFKALPEFAPRLREALRIMPSILRFLIVTPPIKAQVREPREMRPEG